jgi:Ca2+-binding RTX toxin-like protein
VAGGDHSSGDSKHILEALRSIFSQFINQANCNRSNENQGGSGGSGQTIGVNDDISVTEDGGRVRVVDNVHRDPVTNAFEEMYFSNVTKININLGGGNDTLAYNGNTVDANIHGGDGADYIALEDAGTANSNVYGDDDNDVITVVHSNKSEIDAGAGDDVIYVNTGFEIDPSEYNYADSKCTIVCGSGNDQVFIYAGKNTVSGGAGADVVTLSGGTVAASSATVYVV